MIDYPQRRSRVFDRNISEPVCIRFETRNVFLGGDGCATVALDLGAR
jgi:hypothetical protein